jgi:hypothetical protein
MKNNWKAGDIAICIRTDNYSKANDKGQPPPLRLNAEYVVQSVYECTCGNVLLDVGLLIRDGVRCISCGNCQKTTPDSDIHWAGSRRFIKKEFDTKFLEERLEYALEVEDYKMAADIQKRIKEVV